ncbi:MAG: hypothetical protein WCJ81_02115 [bacterium]
MSYILDIDIDFRSDHTPTDEEKHALQKLYAGAKLCTIALSPYFMPLETAISTVKLLFLQQSQAPQKRDLLPKLPAYEKKLYVLLCP